MAFNLEPRWILNFGSTARSRILDIWRDQDWTPSWFHLGLIRTRPLTPRKRFTYDFSNFKVFMLKQRLASVLGMVVNSWPRPLLNPGNKAKPKLNPVLVLSYTYKVAIQRRSHNEMASWKKNIRSSKQAKNKIFDIKTRWGIGNKWAALLFEQKRFVDSSN